MRRYSLTRAYSVRPAAQRADSFGAALAERLPRAQSRFNRVYCATAGGENGCDVAAHDPAPDNDSFYVFHRGSPACSNIVRQCKFTIISTSPREASMQPAWAANRWEKC